MNLNRNLNSLDVHLNRVIERFRETPIDLMDTNDADGEYRYLLHSRSSYLRTINDIVGMYARSSDKKPAGEIKVLEIGSFLGAVSIILAELGFSVTAMDIPEFMGNCRLQQKFIQSGVRWLSCNLKHYTIPVDSEQYDLVIMCETLEHLNFNPIPVLAEINRVLVTGGYLYISLPNLASLVNRIKLLMGKSIHNPVSDFYEQLERENNMIVGIHWREYTKKEITAMLDRTGFDVIRHYYSCSLQSHFSVKWLYYLFPQIRPNQTAITIKRIESGNDFHFCEATSP